MGRFSIIVIEISKFQYHHSLFKLFKVRMVTIYRFGSISKYEMKERCAATAIYALYMISVSFS